MILKMIYTVQRVLKSYYGQTIELWIAVDMNKDKFLEIHTSGIKMEPFQNHYWYFRPWTYLQIIAFNSLIEREKWE